MLPIGSIEQHSRHLPLGTDWIAATALAHRVARELGAIVLPALPVSMGRCHKPMAGTVWLRPMTLADAVTDLVRSLAASGIRHVLIVNGHGGNFTLEVAARELNMAHPELTVLLPPMTLRSNGPPIFETAGMEVHAGESETSVMMAIDASLVGDDRVDYIPPVGREYLDYALVGDISPEGVWGKPILATRDKGERAFEARVQSLVEYVRETFERVAKVKGGARAPVLGAAGRRPRWLDWGPWAIGAGLNARSTTFEVSRARPATAILPIATVEAHGPHLPAGTDVLIVEAVARRRGADRARRRTCCPRSRSAPRRTCADSGHRGFHAGHAAPGGAGRRGRPPRDGHPSRRGDRGPGADHPATRSCRSATSSSRPRFAS